MLPSYAVDENQTMAKNDAKSLGSQESALNYEPYIVGIISSVAVVILTEFAIHIRSNKKFNKDRKIQFQILLNELKHNKDMLDKLKSDLKEDKIYSSIVPIPFYNFLNSNIISLEKDQEIIKCLHVHLNNINQLEHAINIIDLRTAGFTEIQANARDILKKNLENAIIEFKNDVDTCISEIKKNIPDEELIKTEH